jgi:hypothetical protein
VTQSLYKVYIPPELPDANVVSEDGAVGELGVGLVPHQLQLSGGEGAHPDIAGRALRPLPLCHKLKITINVPMILKMREIIFFAGKLLDGPFRGIF